MTSAARDLQALIRHPAVARVTEALRAAGAAEAWLVGGAVRDWLRAGALAVPDLDVAAPADARSLGDGAARPLAGTVVPLDETTVRVVFAGPGGPWRLDVARYRGEGIEADLRRRDFTVNALGVCLLGDAPGTLCDPTGGGADLFAGVIRHAYARAFADDPLRTVRAVRLAAGLGGDIAQETRDAVRRAVGGLARVAGERIRDEVFRIFAGADVARRARELEDLGLLAELVPAVAAFKAVPASPPHRLGLWEHSLEVLRLLEAMLAEPRRWFPEDAAEIAARAAETVEGEIGRRSLLLLFALLHDAGKPATRSVEAAGRVRFLGHVEAGAAILSDLAQRLRLGRRAADYLDRLERAHMRPALLASEPAVTPRARYRFVRDVGPVALETLVHSAADVGGTRGTDDPEWERHLAFVREMLAFRRERARPALETPPLTGDDVMAATGLRAGPLIGYILERVTEAVAVGQAGSRAECLALLGSAVDGWRRDFEAGGAPQSVSPGCGD